MHHLGQPWRLAPGRSQGAQQGADAGDRVLDVARGQLSGMFSISDFDRGEDVFVASLAAQAPQIQKVIRRERSVGTDRESLSYKSNLLTYMRPDGTF